MKNEDLKLWLACQNAAAIQRQLKRKGFERIKLLLMSNLIYLN